MEYINKTQQNIYQAIEENRLMKNKVQDFSLLTFRKTKKGVYCPFYNGIFMGCFILNELIDEKELEECGWKLEKEIFVF